MLTEEQVIAAIRIHGGVDSDKLIGLDDDFKTLNIDSLEVFVVLLKIEAITGTKIPDDNVAAMTTGRAILDYCNSKT